MENFEMWLDELKQGIKESDTVKSENAEKELKDFYGLALVQNEYLTSEIEDLKERLED